MRPIIYLCSIFFGSVFFISACQNEPPKKFHHTIFTFGTLLEITLSDVSAELAEEAFEQLENDYQFYHATWNPWQESDLTTVNTAIKNAQKVIPSPSILSLIQQSKILAEQSNNLFNPAIGNLINLWQFHKHNDPNIKPPNKSDIEVLIKKNPRMSDLEINNSSLSSKNPAVQLSFGAFAKGYAIEQSFLLLKKLGINNAIINAGGDLSVSGSYGNRLWNIGIKHPRENTVIGVIKTQDGESVFTSGDYERYYIHNNKRYHHILNPETGYPTTGTSSVTVIHKNAAIADAAATALLVAGPKRWHKIAKNMGVHYVMLIEENGDIHLNPKMAERIELKDKQNHSIVLSQPL